MTPDEPLKDVGYFSVCSPETVVSVCKAFDADVAATFLCLTLGTDSTGLRSSWGREAIRKRTGMSWRRVDRCIGILEKGGFIEWPDKGSRIVNIDLRLAETRPMRDGYHAGLERARNGVEPTTKRETAVRRRMAEDGWLDDKGKLVSRPFGRKAYLPLALAGDIKGQPVEGRTSIIGRIRKARDPLAFALLVEMYEAHELQELGSTDRRFGWKKFEDSSIVMRTAQLNVLLAKGARLFMNREPVAQYHYGKGDEDGIQGYFERVAILADAGAIEYVIGVFEDDEHDAAMVYPLAVERHGKVRDDQPEYSVGVLAVGAAVAIKGNDNPDDWLDWVGHGWIAPVDRLYRQAVIKGVPRLVARPRTKATKIWQAERMENCEELRGYFAGLIAEFRPDFLTENNRLREAVDFKAYTRRTQRDINDLFESPKHTAGCAASSDQDDGFDRKFG